MIVSTRLSGFDTIDPSMKPGVRARKDVVIRPDRWQRVVVIVSEGLCASDSILVSCCSSISITKQSNLSVAHLALRAGVVCMLIRDAMIEFVPHDRVSIRYSPSQLHRSKRSRPPFGRGVQAPRRSLVRPKMVQSPFMGRDVQAVRRPLSV